MRISIVAFDDCMTSAVYGLLDAFNIATRLVPYCNASTWGNNEVLVTTEDGRPADGCGGHRIEAQASFAQASDSDVVIVSPILQDIERVLERERVLVRWLSQFRPNPKLLASACTGAFLLAEAGHLNGRRATTNVNFRTLFAARYPDATLAIDERIVEDRMVVCAGSTSAFLDLAVHIVDRLGGHELAVSTAKALSIDRNPASQRPYLLFIAPRDHGDEQVLKLQDWIEANHNRPIGAKEIARAAAMSVRNLTRRFRDATGQSPNQYLRTVRLETSKRLLEADDTPLARLAARVGYGDTRAFIRAFGESFGLSPGQYRAKFKMR